MALQKIADSFDTWAKNAQAYLDSLSEEQRDYLRLTELSLRDAWGKEDDIWDDLGTETLREGCCAEPISCVRDD